MRVRICRGISVIMAVGERSGHASGHSGASSPFGVVRASDACGASVVGRRVRVRLVGLRLQLGLPARG